MKRYKHTTAKFVAASTVSIGVLFIILQLVANSSPEQLAEVAPSKEVAEDIVFVNETTAESTTLSSSSPSDVVEETVDLTTTISSGPVEYYVPKNHLDSIDVTVILDSNNIVTEVSSEHVASNGESAQYQAGFDNAYAQYVVGESIETVDLSRIAGASLTTDAFNLAVEDIVNQL